MGGLKFLRQVIGLVWIAEFIWGVVALFQGNWVVVGVAVVLWLVTGLVFGATHAALERTELRGADASLSRIAGAVEADHWLAALVESQKLVKLLEASANRDKTSLGRGNGQNMEGAFGIALVGHGVLLGANGLTDEAQVTLDRGLLLLRDLAQSNPQLSDHLRTVWWLRESEPTLENFRTAARRVHSFA